MSLWNWGLEARSSILGQAQVNNFSPARMSSTHDLAIGSWLMDLAEEVPPSVELYGSDVSSNNFPQTYYSNVHFLEASATQLPPEWTGKFDVVNQRMLLGALRAGEWPIALTEIMRVLKPGGCVQFAELDLPNCIMAGPAVRRFRDLSFPFYEKLGLLIDAGQRIPRMAKEAGFVEITSEKKYGPAGKSWGKMGELGVLSNGGAVKNIGPAMVKLGVMTEEEFVQLYSSLLDEFETMEGTRYVYRMVCARKPL